MKFSKIIVKNKSKRKINFIYHFLVKKSTWKNRSIDYKKCEYLPDKKNPIVMKTCFSKRKLMEQFGNPPLSKWTPPPSFQLTPLFLSNFFMRGVLFVQISKTRNPSNFSGGGNYVVVLHFSNVAQKSQKQLSRGVL